MGDLRRSTQMFLWALGALTLAVAAAGATVTSMPGGRVIALALLFFALQVVATLFPLDIAPKQKLSLYTSVVIVAVLLIEPLIALLVAGGGTLLAQAVRRQPSTAIVFNASQTALQAGVAGMAVSMSGWDYQDIRFDRVSSAPTVLIAVALVYGIGASAVAVVVGLEEQHAWRRIVREIPAHSGMEDVSQFALGLLAVVIIDARIWAFPLLLILAVSVYRASKHMAALREHERLLRIASEDSARLREEFLMTASHELRTPLTSIKAAAQMLARRLARPDQHDDPRRAIDLSDQVLVQVDRLQVLVDDLLDATRIQQGRLELRRQQTDIVELTRQVIDRFDAAPERHQRHHIELDAPESIDGIWDPARIDHVISNLVSNALKYSPDGGEVHVRIVGDDTWVQLDVSDTGIGVPVAEQDQLFEPFARGSNIQQTIDGTGLGLFIASRIVHGHHGTIDLSSTPGSGTTATVRLPRREHA